jgi:pyrimidine operon attenuation protein/uracil phosphoribosyltransferase
MIRRSLIAGTAADWIAALRVIDRGKRRLPLREQNFILDNIITAQAAEAEARAVAIERLPPRRKLPRLTR